MTSLPIYAPGSENLQPQQADGSSFRWATVTQAWPAALRIRLDGDTLELPMTPDTLDSPNTYLVGSRVWVQIAGRRVIVLGRANAGTSDSGWVDLTPAAGFSSSPTGTQSPAGCRLLGNVIRFRGVLTGTINVNTSHTVATVPVGYRPSTGTNFNSVQSTGGFVGWANVTDTGTLSVHFKTPYASGTATIDLTAISYTKD